MDAIFARCRKTSFRGIRILPRLLQSVAKKVYSENKVPTLRGGIKGWKPRVIVLGEGNRIINQRGI